jgi:ferredoxin
VRVDAEESLCIGAGQCVRWAPEVFDQDPGRGVVVVLTALVPDGPAAATLRKAVAGAVRACPAGALTAHLPDDGPVGPDNDEKRTST